MGCCESVEEDDSYQGGPRPGGMESAQNQRGEEKALRKVDCSKEPREIICGGLRLRYAFFSQKGYYPDDPHKPNQDAYSITERFGPVGSNDSFFAVYDGHGRDGDLCAQFARDKLPGILAKNINQIKEQEAKKHRAELEKIVRPDRPTDPLSHVELSREQMQDAALRAHVECNIAMHRDPSLDDSLSGTTAISAYVHGRRNRLTICNVGDSRAVLGKTLQSNNGYGQRQTLKAFPLSRDQTPYRKDERIRIRATGARILSLDQLEGLEPINENEDSENPEGDLELGEELDEGGDPPRVWSPEGDYPGTAFTRSLGDSMAEELGVFAEPEMLTREIKPDDRVIVLASDGIFEFLTNQSVIDICAKFTDPLEACRAVVAESYELWLQYELRTDDITIIVIFVDPFINPVEMYGEYVTSSFRNLADGTKPTHLLPQDGSESEEPAEDVLLPDVEVRPVRTRMTKEKAQEIEKLKQQAMAQEDYAAELNKEVDLEQLYTEKTASEKARISDAIKTSVMFRNVTPDQRELIYGVMEHIPVKAGTWVIKQGSVGDRFYIIDEGVFEVRIVGEGEEDDGTGGALIHVYEGSVAKHIHPCFGELALMYSAPRSASIIARSDGHLWGLHRSAFRQVLAQAQGTRKELAKTLSKLLMFQNLEEEEVTKLAAAFDEIAFGRGENIVEQGHFGDAMYVITSGSCELVKIVKGIPQNQTLKAGDCFGQEVIVDQQKYGATVVSLQTTTGWKIDRAVLAKTVPVDKLRRRK
ncbi:mechanosensitive ion channel [Nitzschia inconspicua]|uniref:Mechanosensitive ion channel n=1 Tax=Nitzschia inconspicua TaxID=303405 RepID=A0A9K3PMG9_9STRA|nr:mechanosensitive ion channel [Nitzschia inconspicua]